ncbi:MAG: hypothetical protein ACR2NP_20185, partial [Pirellulaceae bacterium]
MLLGLALIAGGLLQFGLWTGRGVRLRRMDHTRFKTELELLHAELYKLRSTRDEDSAPAIDESTQTIATQNTKTWTDFRPFHVARLQKETANCTSVYLVPADGRPIQDYRPG